MKRLMIVILMLGLLAAFAACGKGNEGSTAETDPKPETGETGTSAETSSDPETDSEPSPVKTETETETETENGSEPEVDPSPASNWEGAAGCYYNENDITLEVVLRGTVEKRSYDFIFYTNEDGHESEIFSIEGASEVNGNELRVSKNGVDYLFLYQPDDELPRIRVKRENNAGSADLDGLYSIVLG